MIARVKRYVDNYGLAWSAVNFLVMGYIAWLVLSTLSGPIGILLIPAAGMAVLVTYLLSDWMARHAAGINRVQSAVQWVIIVMLVTKVTGMLVLPGIVWLGVFGLVVVSLSANFWMLSHPDVYTKEGWDRQAQRFERVFGVRPMEFDEAVEAEDDFDAENDELIAEDGRIVEHKFEQDRSTRF